MTAIDPETAEAIERTICRTRRAHIGEPQCGEVGRAMCDECRRIREALDAEFARAGLRVVHNLARISDPTVAARYYRIEVLGETPDDDG